MISKLIASIVLDIPRLGSELANQEPDTKGLQLAPLKRYLVDHPKVTFAWF